MQNRIKKYYGQQRADLANAMPHDQHQPQSSLARAIGTIIGGAFVLVTIGLSIGAALGIGAAAAVLIYRVVLNTFSNGSP